MWQITRHAAIIVATTAVFLAPSVCAQEITSQEYGNVADVAAVHQAALANFATIVRTLVGADIPSFSVFYYDPDAMADVEVQALVSAYCTASEPSWPGCTEGRAPDVQAGELCGGVCGTTPTMVYKVERCCGDDLDTSFVQEGAIHEATHIIQIGYGADRYNRDGGDAEEDWRHSGPRWFGEGTAMWLGEKLLAEYPQHFSPKNPARTNFGRTSADACASLLGTEQARGIDLTNAIQASDEPWQAIWINQDGQDAYYQMVYEGGFCAVDFIVSSLSTTEAKAAALLRVMRNAQLRDSWEVAFLEEFVEYSSMQAFYEVFERGNGNVDFSYPASAPASNTLAVLLAQDAAEDDDTADGTGDGTSNDNGAGVKSSDAMPTVASLVALALPSGASWFA